MKGKQRKIEPMNQLFNKGYLDPSHNVEERLFACYVFSSTMTYVKKNYNQITDPGTQCTCFLIAAAFSKDPKIITFLIEKFHIDANYVDANGNNCLNHGCINQQSLKIIRYMITV